MKNVLIGEILEPEKAKANQEKNETRVRAKFWQTLRKAFRQVPFSHDVVAAYYCALDPQTPARTRAILLAALGYFVLPLDWVPDFILGFGFTDDIAVLMAAFSAVRSSLRDEHHEAARLALADAPEDGDTDGAEPTIIDLKAEQGRKAA